MIGQLSQYSYHQAVVATHSLCLLTKEENKREVESARKKNRDSFPQALCPNKSERLFSLIGFFSVILFRSVFTVIFFSSFFFR